MADKVIQANSFFEKHILRDHTSGPFPHIIIAEDIASEANMGFIIRLADNMGIQNVYFISKSSPKLSAIKKTAGSAFSQVQIEFLSLEELRIKLEDGFKWIAIETMEKSVSVYDFHFSPKMAFIIGNERQGLSEEMSKFIEASIYIPMPGNTKSMNVSHALAVVLFEWYGTVE